ncbi:MAG: hypothetical protein IT381_04925 [Deltaproteobacteria bacterium]|nr:hypothetical protein [Deltaproteobacteria bacterium]
MATRVLLALLVLASGCVHRHVQRKAGTQSFVVEVIRPTGDGVLGTKEQPIPYATNAAPFRIDLRVTAIGWDGNPDPGFSGRLLIDARPGVVFPNEFNVLDGVGTVSVQLSNSYGETHIWLEDCGTRRVPMKKDCTLEERQAYLPECLQGFSPGTLATGISPTIRFAQPSVTQVQVTSDNTTSPLISLQGDRCASLADPRYVDITNLTGQQLFNVPRAQRMAPVGNIINVSAGEMIITAIDNEGFYLSDISPEATNTGFNSIFVFNFNYPEGLEVGDRLKSIQGVPAEFSGSTQLTNPFWIRDPGGPYKSKLPKPFYISPALYNANMGKSGANINTQLDLERLEGGIVCMDGLHVPSHSRVPYVPPRPCGPGGDKRCAAGEICVGATDTEEGECFRVSCDLNKDGRIDRFGDTEEKACETACYENPDCFEGSSYGNFQQWGAYITNITTTTKCGPMDPPCLAGSICNPSTLSCDLVQKVALATANALPQFRPDRYVADKLAAGEAPQTLAVTGNLIQVLASRPVWLIQPRGPEDITFGGTCQR